MGVIRRAPMNYFWADFWQNFYICYINSPIFSPIYFTFRNFISGLNQTGWGCLKDFSTVEISNLRRTRIESNYFPNSWRTRTESEMNLNPNLNRNRILPIVSISQSVQIRIRVRFEKINRFDSVRVRCKFGIFTVPILKRFK